ncbi:MAG: UbiA family prenyltransferase [Candidatus Burarchaeum sp.]|nr:UbiA family prenyltransferase [Candidatus Burarchaeum sp.]MDO8339830.1 UbiA family prenyltransferase [Candidatus Burarchaeum sp.]
MDVEVFFRLTRLEHAVMLSLAAIIGEIVATGAFPPAGFLLLTAAAPFLIGMASFALNDLLDIETDRINKRTDRPLVSGEASKGEAFDIIAFGFIAGNLVALLASWTAFLIAVIFSTFAILYSLKLKDLPLAGNVYIACTLAIPFIYGALVVSGTVSDDLAVISTMAFLVGLARELMKTADDVEGDKAARKARTLPMVIGPYNTILVASALYVLAIVISYFPFLSGTTYRWSWPYFILITFANSVFALVIYNSVLHGLKFLRRARNLSLLALGAGLLGFLVGVLL